MRINTTPVTARTHEGAPAISFKPLDELRRTVLACLLWERSFYESGEAVADRIKRLVPLCEPHDVATLAIEAREKQRLRHAPLKLVRELARTPSRAPDGLVAETLARVIQRADELTEFLAMYWNGDGKKPIAKQVKKGLARAFRKFDAYQLAKYNRASTIKLRDVLFLVHAKPVNDAQADLWKRLACGGLDAPDTWEVALSSGADKKATFERLIASGKLGYLALLRNLRNMQEAGVALETVAAPLLTGAATSKALPFRYVAAARAVPAWEPVIDESMQAALSCMDRLSGKTAVLVDVSGSMNSQLSSKSDLSRQDAACALAVLLRGIGDDVRVFSFSDNLVEVPARRGMALIDAIARSQPNHGTYLGAAIEAVKSAAPETDRLIVITDEESADVVGSPIGRGYMLNVASTQNGVGYGAWTRITGFSESVVQYIAALELSSNHID